MNSLVGKVHADANLPIIGVSARGRTLNDAVSQLVSQLEGFSLFLMVVLLF